MALNLRNPNGYDGSPGTSTRQGIVRFATAAEAAAGLMDNVAISPATAQSATALDFASPPVLGFGSTTPRPVASTTLSSSLGVSVTGGDIINSHSSSAADVTIEVTNSNNTNGASRAGVEIATGGSSSGDPYLSFQISGVGASTMTMGLDNSASDLFVISNSTAIGTSNALTLSQAGALTATTSITATLGDITATNGNIVRGTAGNKDVYTSLATTTTAGANSAGTVTLVGGTATISTTSVTAASKIRIYRQGVGATGAAALGILSVGTITASTSFVINSVQAADATALQASDVSVVFWEIVN